MKNVEVIKNYLRDKEMSVLRFSKFIGLSKPGMYKIMKNGKVRIDTALKIQKATNGEIKISDFDITWPGNRVPKNFL